MSEITLEPDPPHRGKSFTICFEWSPPSPGTTVEVEVVYLPLGGSFSTTFVCPIIEPYRHCRTITPPDGAKGFTVHPFQGEAPDVSRTLLD